MKKRLIILSLPLITVACVTVPLSEQLKDLDDAQALLVLTEQCESEAGRGHHTGSHPHVRHRPENKTHASNMLGICNQMIAETQNRRTLVDQCKAEAKKGSFSSRYLFETHVSKLTEICDEFGKRSGASR